MISATPLRRSDDVAPLQSGQKQKDTGVIKSIQGKDQQSPEEALKEKPILRIENETTKRDSSTNSKSDEASDDSKEEKDDDNKEDKDDDSKEDEKSEDREENASTLTVLRQLSEKEEDEETFKEQGNATAKGNATMPKKKHEKQKYTLDLLSSEHQRKLSEYLRNKIEQVKLGKINKPIQANSNNTNATAELIDKKENYTEVAKLIGLEKNKAPEHKKKNKASEQKKKKARSERPKKKKVKKVPVDIKDLNISDERPPDSKDSDEPNMRAHGREGEPDDLLYEIEDDQLEFKGF